MVADVSPRARDLDLLHLGAGVDCGPLHAFAVGRELGLPEGRPAGRHEDDVVRHHVHERWQIARLAGGYPGVDELANPGHVLLVRAQGSLFPATPASAKVAMPL